MPVAALGRSRTLSGTSIVPISTTGPLSDGMSLSAWPAGAHAATPAVAAMPAPRRRKDRRVKRVSCITTLLFLKGYGGVECATLPVESISRPLDRLLSVARNTRSSTI